MAAVVTYTVTNGEFPITVTLYSVLPPYDVVATDTITNLDGYGVYVFSGVPDGDYWLMLTDNLGCTINLSVCDLTPKIDIVYNCIFDFTLDISQIPASPTPTPTITPTVSTTTTPTVSTTTTPTPSITPSITPSRTTTPTVTLSITQTKTVTPTITPSVTPTMTKTPTPSPTPTPGCTRPAGLKDYVLYTYDPLDFDFTHTLADACAALCWGSGYRGAGGWAASLTPGQTVYVGPLDGSQTDCELYPTGYYITIGELGVDWWPPRVVYIVNGIVIGFQSCPSCPASPSVTPTHSPTVTPSISTSPSRTLSVTPSSSICAVADPIACYDFEESCGIIHDGTGNGHDLDYTTLIDYQQPGKINSYSVNIRNENINYIGDGSFITSINDTNRSQLNVTDLTISAWIKCAGFGIHERVIVSRMTNLHYDIYNDYRDMGGGYIFSLSTSNQLMLTIADDTSAYSFLLQTGSTPNNGVWHHVMATFKNSTKETVLYIDGIENIRGTLTYNLGYSAPYEEFSGLTIGNLNYWGNYMPFMGFIDGVMLYNRTLTPTDAICLYNAGVGRSCAITPTPTPTLVPVACYNFEELCGPFRDGSGNSHDLDYISIVDRGQPGKVDNYSIRIYNIAGKDTSSDGSFITSINDPNVSQLNVSNLTLSGWVKYTSIGGTIISRYTHNDFYDHNDYRHQGGGYRLHIAGSNGLILSIANSDGDWDFITQNGVPSHNDGQWHHVAATFNNLTKEATLYIDGTLNCKKVLIYNLSYSPFQQFTGLTVGNQEDWGNYKPFVGNLDAISLYDKVLCPGDILNLYNGGNGRGCPVIPTPTPTPTPSLVACYDFEETTGYFLDGSGNGHTLDFIRNIDRNQPGKINLYSVKIKNTTVTIPGDGSIITATYDPNYAEFNVSNLTVSAWIKFSDMIGGTIVSRVTSTDFYDHNDYRHQGGGYWLTIVSGKLQLTIANGQVTDSRNYYWIDQSGIVYLNNNIWHHVVGTFNNTTREAALYIDGILNNRVILPLNLSYSPYQQYTGITIGNRSDFGDYVPFTGFIDGVSIYDGVLCNNDIVELYNSGNGIACPVLPPCLRPGGLINYTMFYMQSLIDFSGSLAAACDTLCKNGAYYGAGAYAASLTIGQKVYSGLETDTNCFTWSSGYYVSIGAIGEFLNPFVVHIVEGIITELPTCIMCSPSPTTTPTHTPTVTPTQLINPYTNSLQAYWKFDEATGLNTPFYDSTINNHDLITVNNVSHQPAGSGIINGCAIFGPDSVRPNSYAAGDTSLNYLDLSISCWVKINTSPDHPGAFRYIYDKVGTGNQGVRFYISPSGHPEFAVCNGIYVTIFTGSTSVVNIGEWAHIVVTYSSITHQGNFYINNQNAYPFAQDAGNPFSVSTTPVYPIGTTLYVGNNRNIGGPLNGYLDELAVWSRALTFAEANYLWNGGAGHTYTPTP